jgi:KamA family protein
MALAKELETLQASSRVRVIERFDSTPGRGYRAWTRNDIDRIPQLAGLSPTRRDTMKAVSAVLPFRVNPYIVEELIDWSDIPHDPIFQLTFPQRGMLEPQDFDRVFRLLRSDAPPREIEAVAREIQATMNPHPAGQRELNVPRDDAGPIQGLQHKYKETVLFFPAAGQTCHAYCSYCFRWAQFVGAADQRFASRESATLVQYLRRHPEVTSVLITGGDPMVMKTSVLRRFVEPLLDPSLEQLESIRFGTKAPGYWPQRFDDDDDADDLMALFEEVRASGRHLALMAHYSHPRELSTPVAERALRRMQSAGATVRCQAPLIHHVNDDAAVWAELWRRQVRLGAVPYYMFVERDTGPRRYFEVGLARALEVFNDAYRQVSGLARTVRGPSMSTTPGKILVDGVVELCGESHFVLKLIQARNPEWVGRTFFARFDPDATWIDELKPPLGEDGFFFESCGPASAP